MKRSTHTASSAVAMLIFSTVTMAAAAAATVEFKVGGDIGWQVPPATNPEFYNYWASTNRFQIGDSLAFLYKNDSVLMVKKWGYYHCDSSHPILSFNQTKAAVIKLDKSGPFYFISAFQDHCKSGQRLLVQVMSPHLIAPPPESNYPDASPPPSSPNAGAALPVVGPVAAVIMAAIVGLLFF